MRVTASAPGKLVIAGDYAVLEGAPAVVMALNRRARVTLDDESGDGFCIDAPQLGIAKARGHMKAGAMHWQEAGMGERLHLVGAVLEGLAGSKAQANAFSARLDTQAFFSPYRQGDKLGLGSSAALTVALIGAIHALRERKSPGLAAMIDMHRQMQDGRGSGIDVAASLLGGVLVYRLHKGRPRVVQTAWPSGLALCCVWSGRSASTGKALARLEQWRRGHPADYDTLMNELTVEATAVAAALQADDAEAMVAGITAYAAGLGRLGESSGIDIICAEHRAVAGIAADCGVAYKTCGAGGGDVGVACATDTERLTRFAGKVNAAGFYVLDVGIDVDGLAVEASVASNRRQTWTTYA